MHNLIGKLVFKIAMHYWVQKKQAKAKASPRLQQYKESDYMDPAQGLCLGALFDIAATNVRQNL